ncbi:peroxin 19 family protein [Klebsormidium nitens]|uniref:Peroxin 19 family protein n=1 Tax=Klebsormidium nitens TaxID=105231 RepID=A0A0U9HMN7_KLENI|nr:peroxin 19 family protein [Klebsormidium nitens]|eukprot:GAQ80592.1 peroxin 19 family protein [Klebsormidium nitens]
MADHDDDLHQLLDSALDGFTKVDSRAAASGRKDLPLRGDAAVASTSSAAYELNAKQKEKQAVQGLGSGVGLRQKKSGKGSGKKAAPAGASSSKSEGSESGRRARGSEAGKTVEALHEQTRQTVEGMDPGGAENLDELMAQLQQMAGGEDMQSLMDNMMKQLLSKDVLYEPMKEIGRRYPTWLQENDAKLSTEDKARYGKQYQYIQRLLHVYENDPDNFEQVTALMQEMQECGHPPDEIIQELAPGVVFGEDGMPSLPDLLGAGTGGSGPGGQPDCSIM